MCQTGCATSLSSNKANTLQRLTLSESVRLQCRQSAFKCARPPAISEVALLLFLD